MKPELAVGEHVLAGVDDTDPETGALLIPDTSVWFFDNGAVRGAPRPNADPVQQSGRGPPFQV